MRRDALRTASRNSRSRRLTHVKLHRVRTRLMDPFAPTRHARAPWRRRSRVSEGEAHMFDTYYDLMRRQGISRRSFVKFCSLTAASLGLSNAGAQQIAQAMQTKPRTPVIWLHGLECTCCTESFIRSAHP